MKLTYDGLACELWSGWREILGLDVQKRREERRSGRSSYLNEPALYKLLVCGKKAMIDLREDHLSRCL